MTDNTKNTINNLNQDPNQLSDDELNAINGGTLEPIKRASKKVRKKVSDYVKKHITD